MPSASSAQPIEDPTLLIAQRAADWLIRVPAGHAQCVELASWMRQSPRHVRELLLAQVWDLVLCQSHCSGHADCDPLGLED